MVGSKPTGTRVSAAQIIRLGVVLTLAAAVLMSVRFARFDWTRVPLEYLPHSLTLEVSPECTEQVGSYITSSGRTIQPTAMDDQQYLAMVELYRGTPADEIQAECLYRPYTGRFAQPWLAHFLPFEDEGVSLALVNAAMMIGAIWAMLLALRKQGASVRATAFAGACFALGWNTLFYGAGVLTDPGPLFVVTVGWLLAVHRRWFWCLALMLVSIPVRETVLVLLPVVLAGLWNDRVPEPADHDGRRGRSRVAFVTTAAVAVASSLVAIVLWGRVAPVADATFATEIRYGIAMRNLFSVSITTVLVAAGPLYVPAILRWFSQVRELGAVRATLEPAAAGLGATLLVLAWVLLGADLSPRFTWIGFPFAAAMCAEYIDAGGLAKLMGRLSPERLVGRARTDGRIVASND